MKGLAAVLALLLVSCSPNTPRGTAEGYLGALGRVDFSAAAGFVAEEGRANFDTLRKVYSGLGPEEQKKFRMADWAVTGETVTGDTATVDFTFDGQSRGQLALRKVDGVWKVDHRQTF
jgi:hypothetical protein